MLQTRKIKLRPKVGSSANLSHYYCLLQLLQVALNLPEPLPPSTQAVATVSFNIFGCSPAFSVKPLLMSSMYMSFNEWNKGGNYDKLFFNFSGFVNLPLLPQNIETSTRSILHSFRGAIQYNFCERPSRPNHLFHSLAIINNSGDILPSLFNPWL